MNGVIPARFWRESSASAFGVPEEQSRWIPAKSMRE